MDAQLLDLSTICRTCKGVTDNMLCLFESDESSKENPRIDEMLMACASIQVSSTDGLPALICEQCIAQLRKAFIFKNQCEKVDASFREHAKVDRIKEELQNTEFIESLNVLLNDDFTPAPKTVEDPLPTNQIPTDYIQIMDNNQMILTCHECCKVFTTLEGLRCHKRIHSGVLFKCKQCDKEYTRLNHLQRHEQSHGRRKVHVCRICNKTLTRMEHLKRHLVTHLREKPFACKTCNRGFSRIEHLNNHTPRCKGDNAFICNICNKAFNRADSLEVHKKLHENINPNLPTLDNLDSIDQHYYEIDYDEETELPFTDTSDEEEESEMPEPEAEITEAGNTIVYEEQLSDPEGDLLESKFKVEVEILGDNLGNTNTMQVSNYEAGAGESTKLEKDRESDSADSEYLPKKLPKRGRGRPRKTIGQKRRFSNRVFDEDDFGEVTCTVCKKLFSNIMQLDKHARIEHVGLKVHKCNVCEKEFIRANHLKRHMLSHSINKPYRCGTCTKSFSRRDHLSQHQKLHSRISADCECEICFKTFNRADHLAKHKACKHGIGEKVISEKKFECSICNKAFTTEKYRDVHVKGHSGEKKYRCKTCDKSFLSKSHLTEHMKFHNDHSKKFLCSECGQRFIRNDYLIIHMRRHRGEKPFKCKFCGKGFPRTTDLTVHERYHTGEKTHLCTICGRGFGRAYNLTVHMRTHTGEKPYQCTYCDAAFAQGNDLKAHVRRHTGERFQCELCTESFLMGYLLTQHKRSVHGLNVVSNIRRLQPVQKYDKDEKPPIEIPLPKPVVPDVYNNIQAHLTAQMLRDN